MVKENRKPISLEYICKKSKQTMDRLNPAKSINIITKLGLTPQDKVGLIMENQPMYSEIVNRTNKSHRCGNSIDQTFHGKNDK